MQAGTGNAQGTIVTDNVSIGSLSVANLKFGVTNTESTDFSGAEFDGLSSELFVCIVNLEYYPNESNFVGIVLQNSLVLFRLSLTYLLKDSGKELSTMSR
jgi:hypothetical protein